ncbi:MAG: Gfo/Idh/MocA family oxidoreductase [Thermoanaerobaculia bacterium]
MAGRKDKVRYAVVGLGDIAQASVLPAFFNARRNSELVALVSGSREKLSRLGARYAVAQQYSYEQFAECLAEVDAVYLALPNHLHREFAVAAARAGVHVLCEKPLAPSVAEAEEMVAAAVENGVRLMTAYRLHFEPGTLSSLEIARSGELGDLRYFHAAFSMQVAEGDVRLQPEVVGGGPLFDIGVYGINAARQFLGAEPIEIIAIPANNGESRFASTHEMISAVLRFPGDRLASITASAGAASSGWYEIVGTRGRLRMDPGFGYGVVLQRVVEANGSSRRSHFSLRDQFAPEILHFSDCVLEHREPGPSGLEGLADVRVIAAILESSRTRSSVRLPERTLASRPDLTLSSRRFPPPAKNLK